MLSPASHFANEDAFPSRSPPAEQSGAFAPPSGAVRGTPITGAEDDDGDGSSTGRVKVEEVTSFRGKKISALEALFRECSTMYDIIQVYWDHSRVFHSIELPTTTGRQCDAQQKVKDLTREVFVVQGELFDMHIYDDRVPQQMHERMLEEARGNGVYGHVSAAMAVDAARKDQVTECFRRVVARLNGAAQEEFERSPEFGRKCVLSAAHTSMQ